MSSATAERTFSTLRQVKNYFKNYHDSGTFKQCDAFSIHMLTINELTRLLNIQEIAAKFAGHHQSKYLEC